MVILMIDKLKKQEKELKATIETWEEYHNSPKKHFNVPIPRDLFHCAFTDVKKEYIDEAKWKLAYWKEVSKVYDESEFIVTEYYRMGNFHDADSIKEVQITPKIRKQLHNMCDDLEKNIQAIDKSYGTK